MTAPQDPYRPTGDGETGGPASDPGPGGPGSGTPGGAPAGFPTPPGAGTGEGYGAPTAYGAPAGYGAPSAYGTPGYGPPAGQQPGGPGMPQLATWGSRVGAALIDAAIVFGVIVVGFVLGALLSSVSDVLGGLVAALGYVAGFGFYVWQLYVQGQTGQTIGKKQVGLRLLGEQDGRPIGPGLSIGRYFVHVVDSIPCYVGYLWPLWDAKRQTFADKILKTVVVKE